MEFSCSLPQDRCRTIPRSPSTRNKRGEHLSKQPQQSPSDLKVRGRGRRLWRAVVSVLVLDEPEACLLHEACRCLDNLDDLDRLVRQVGLVLPDGRMSPWLVESRQQRLALARLLASLRLPPDLADVGSRPQRRGASRPPYGLKVIGGTG